MMEIMAALSPLARGIQRDVIAMGKPDPLSGSTGIQGPEFPHVMPTRNFNTSSPFI
jgi:hypothetical protein